MSIEAILLIIAIIMIGIFGAALIIYVRKISSNEELSRLDSRLSRLDGKIDLISSSGNDLRGELENKFNNLTEQNNLRLDKMSQTMEKKLGDIEDKNSAALERMRATVDEKLQRTLEERISSSFSQVSRRLEEVYKGLGEMQTLASGVGDLKKVLSNVKSRGIIGEYQLGAILGEILTPEQYDENAATKKGSKNVVEFAVKLPSDDGGFIYLPIDSKFPGDTYSALCDAYDSGDRAAVDLARKHLRQRLLSEAKDISEKYIDPPHTTEFAIMFLPFEGLYSEAVNNGMVEELQNKFKVNIAGPSTMAALLNSLQMGFKTLAVQKRSTEVWRVLEEVKTEFGKFTGALAAAQERIRNVDSDLEKLVGARTRQMQRKLEKMSSLDESGPLFLDNQR